MSNLNFMKVFVATDAAKFKTNVLPTALLPGEIGLIEVNQFGVSIGGAGATPAPASKPVLKLAQNVGDSLYATVQSKPITVDSVTRWLGKAATAATVQITYLGFDEIDGTKDIAATCGQELVVNFNIYEKKLARWYNPVGFHKRLIIDTGCCPDCGSPCTAADKLFIANKIADQINTGLVRVGDFAAQNELGVYLTATVVTNGGIGAALRVGVKIVTKAIDNDKQSALNNCDPNKWFEFQTYYFSIGNVYNGFCDGTQLQVTTTQMANPGSGWAAGLAAMEAESQGFDRVRDALTAYPFSSKNGYVIYATAGVKYDYFHLTFRYTHRVNTGTTSFISEPYEIILACPTGAGATIQAAFNAWLVNKFPAVAI